MRGVLHANFTITFGVALSFALWGRCFAQQPAEPPAGVDYQRDIVYGQGGGQPLHLDLARPAKMDRPAPCIVVIHGGAWRGGNKEAHTDLVFQFASRGYVAATVQYRLCPQHVFPAQVEDVKCAVRYLRAHADQYQIDRNRFGGVGFSAGAHLVMMLGAMGRDDGLEGEGGWPDRSSQLQAVVSFAGPTVLDAPDIPDVSKPLVKDFIGGTAAEKPEAFQRASPATYATAGDAPMLLFQGTKDPLVPHTQAVRMAEALSAAGVAGRIELLVGAGHGWGGRVRERSLAQMAEFLAQHLQHETGEAP